MDNVNNVKTYKHNKRKDLYIYVLLNKIDLKGYYLAFNNRNWLSEKTNADNLAKNYTLQDKNHKKAILIAKNAF